MEYFLCALVGGAGGFIRVIISGKGIICLPKVCQQGPAKYVNLGILAPVIIGAFAGWLASAQLEASIALAALAGYAGSDFIENLAERVARLPKKPQ